MEKTSNTTARKTKSWEELTLADNFLFCKIMESEPELCRQLLELLLHIKIDHLEPPQIERTMQESLDAKSVRFDVYTKDDKRIFDIEIQTTDTKNLPKRARYYQSVIDTDNLAKGENYTKLKDSYIIFICLDDIFGKEQPVYFFENLCREDRDIKLNDRAFKIFFNAKNCDKLKTSEEKDFFNFLKGEQAQTAFSRKLEEKLDFAKKNSDWRRHYMTWQQTIDEEKELSFEEGLEEGVQATVIENAQSFYANGASLELIAKSLNMPIEKVKEIVSKTAVAPRS